MTKRVKKKSSKFSFLSRLHIDKSQIFLTIFIAFYAVYWFQVYQITQRLYTSDLRKYWLHHPNGKINIFKSIEKVLNEFGFEKIQMKFENVTKIHMNWHLGWTSSPRGMLPIDYDVVKPHQKLNHFPGNEVLTRKDVMARVLNFKFIPKAFGNADELKAFVVLNPDKKFIQRRKATGRMAISNVSDITFNPYDESVSDFVQVYVDDPLLIEGHKFDFSVFVVITSIEPLRLYYYTDDILLRVCKLPYEPFDPKIVDKYAIGHESMISGVEIPVLKEMIANNKTVKEAMDLYFIAKGINMSNIWKNVEESIRSVVMETQQYFMNHVSLHYLVCSIYQNEHFFFFGSLHIMT